MDTISEILVLAASNHPVVLGIVSTIGALRIVVKPIMTFAHQVVQQTKSTRDDEVLDKIEQSKGYKVLLYTLDWLASVKF